MQFVSYIGASGATWGLVVGDGVVDLGARGSHGSLKDAIAAGRSVDDAASMLELPERFSAYEMDRVRDAVAVVYSELKP